MTNNELLVLKMNLLGGMNEYVKTLKSDGAIHIWNLDGVPYNATEDDLRHIATNNMLWRRACRAFGDICWQYDRSMEQ